jgi:hypothetical protein
VALIETDGTDITAADDWDATGRRVEVVPGTHALSVKLDDYRPETGYGDGFLYCSDGSLVVCFVALPGHTYQTRPVYSGSLWRPEIVDETRAELVRSWVVYSLAGRCTTENGKDGGLAPLTPRPAEHVRKVMRSWWSSFSSDPCERQSE